MRRLIASLLVLLLTGVHSFAAEVLTTIGSATNSVVIDLVTGSGPWTVTLSVVPSDAVVGDGLIDDSAGENLYLITVEHGLHNPV